MPSVIPGSSLSYPRGMRKDICKCSGFLWPHPVPIIPLLAPVSGHWTDSYLPWFIVQSVLSARKALINTTASEVQLEVAASWLNSHHHHRNHGSCLSTDCFFSSPAQMASWQLELLQVPKMSPGHFTSVAVASDHAITQTTLPYSHSGYLCPPYHYFRCCHFGT